jgi:hypothetical protein
MDGNFGDAFPHPAWFHQRLESQVPALFALYRAHSYSPAR